MFSVEYLAIYLLFLIGLIRSADNDITGLRAPLLQCRAAPVRTARAIVSEGFAATRE